MNPSLTNQSNPIEDPTINFVSVASMGTTASASGDANMAPPYLTTLVGKVVCAPSTINTATPFSSPGAPTAGSPQFNSDNDWTISGVPLPGTCSSYVMHVWGKYETDGPGVWRHNATPFADGTGTGSSSQAVLPLTAGSYKAAPKSYKLKPVFPEHDPDGSLLPCEYDFGSKLQSPILSFDEATGWVSPVWKQVLPEPVRGRWILRIFERKSSTFSAELCWQDLQIGVRTLGVWMSKRWNVFGVTEFTLNDSSPSATHLPKLLLEPA